MESTSTDARILLAIEAIEQDKELSVRQAATIYKVNRATLQNRMNGRRARQDVRANSMKLTELEEDAVLRYILELDTRGFPPRLADVGDMANILLKRDVQRVEECWTDRLLYGIRASYAFSRL